MSRAYRYSYNVIGFGEEEISRSADRLAGLGYDAMEVEGEPDLYDPERVRRAAADAGLSISSVCPNFTENRDLSHPDPKRRRECTAYLRSLADFAAAVGAPLFIVAPTSYGRTAPVAGPTQEWGWAVEGVREAGEYARSVGVDLSLECWNRYGSYMLNRLEEGGRMWRETGVSNGGVMADTFHMNIEESKPVEAVRELGQLLNHVHLSDSNRLAPGLGHIDFAAFIRTAREIGYAGCLAFELLPDLPNRFDARGGEASLDEVARQAIEHSKACEHEQVPR